MKTARRRTLPFPLLLMLALLLFSAGLGTGWSGAAAYADRADYWQLPSAESVPTTTEPDLTTAEPIPAAAEPDLTTAEPIPAAAEPVLAAAALFPPQAAAEPSDKPSPAPTAEDGWNLILVNFENPLPDGFTIPDLTQLRANQAVDSRIYSALQRMLDDARAVGLQPVVCSSFRSRDTQALLYEAEVQSWLDRGCTQEDAEARAAMWVARPGTSEHHTGLAVDIVDLSYQLLDEEQEKTPVQQWLMAHCAEYGFILRYPSDKSDLTGIGYEPWHYRYVGAEAAREIMEGGLCLEEYLSG